MTTFKLDSDIRLSWPEKVPRDIIFKRLNEYFKGTQWTLPPPCAVCSRQIHDVEVMSIIVDGNSSFIPLHFDMLRITDPFIIQNCIVQGNPAEFMFDCKSLDGFMLYKPAFHHLPGGNVRLDICMQCHSSLSKGTMPKFALANNLYRGCLPSRFNDLTWVEEMVCARYRYTAHITRLFQSHDPALPNVLHGNTCAHEMNVVSTAAVLPRTVADINEMLSVVFIGPGKFRTEYLKDIFRIRKAKVWDFLLWLTTHNLHYLDMPLDRNILDQYPEDGALPSIENNVVEDNISDASQIFLNETAGPSEHPAEMLKDSNKPDDSFVFLEKVGVSDPEGDRLTGRAFIGAGIRNLVSSMADSTLPDLILHRGSTAIREYKNPALMPGMFPTLWPFGIGGFDDSDRQTPLSFPVQANYYFDIPDHRFRYHHAYSFVALNIIQRRAAHLHTHFTVKKNNFPTIAENLVKVTPKTLLSTARHFEHEGKYRDLTNEQREAMNLLKHVNTVAARVPGSQASQIHIRNEIRSYFGYFGMPQLYFTANPSATHSPIFQVMYGDTNVDLTKRFPQLVPSRERAVRLANDPVAAADFFDFSIKCIFEFLFGWDYQKKCSKPEGGILGHLRAFYGVAELTERANFHGHFLLWLTGASNPSQLHKRLAADDEFKTRFFDFFEDIIHHHLPNDDVQIDPAYEPRVERPPHPPNPSTALLDELNSWESAFITQIKICGEVLQRHVCRPVCHKYGNEGRCRFLFPHEIVEASYFDPDNNSIVLMCRDSTINYFNPYILVFCRHNHDLKCILSGKAAKAASFYITDYITKMGPTTYQMLSLLSKAVSNMPQTDDCSNASKAKILLHKCLSQFTRQQQIHAQQAAHYIRGRGDAISSHFTKPMMSAILLSHVKSLYSPQTSGQDTNNECDDEEHEPIFLKIAINNEGNLMTTNQFHDYYYRAHTLQSMNFYDFSRSVKLEKKVKKIQETPESRSDVLLRHALLPQHPLSHTHQLLQFWNEEHGHKKTEYVPRVVGCSIPRPNAGLLYKIFVLAHFKPFGALQPLIPNGQTFESVFTNYTLTDAAKITIGNWDATDESEDARDADRMKKKAEITNESRTLTNSLFSQDSHIPLLDDGTDQPLFNNVEFATHLQILLLQQSNWFKPPPPTPHSQLPPKIPTTTDALLKQWKISMKTQEATLMQQRQHQMDPSNPTMIDPSHIPQTEGAHPQPTSSSCPKTDTPNINKSPKTTHIDPEDVINHIGSKFGLNKKQWISFRLVARSFIKTHASMSDHPQPIRILLTGPGGTGKTHVVNALRALMAEYGSEHTLRFLAPTGSAASLIDGMTIHKGLGIKIKSNSKGKGNRKPGESGEDYTVLISVRNRTLLRDEWRLVKVLFIDEVSLLSEQLICEVDHALRYATERPDEWFGGITVIFAGDFFQYPPIGGTPLYSPIPNINSYRKNDVPRRLGRLAWKSVDAVICLTEQERMKTDPEYARAVNHLRIRQCTTEDMDLFNSRVIKSADNPDGIDMNTSDKTNSTAIVSTNLLRESINARKAHANCTGPNSPTLITCAAQDDILSGPSSTETIKRLLNMNMTKLTSDGALPGFVPLYVGMPVILRHRNISTELGITNGSQGIVRQINTDTTPHGVTYGKSLIVEFPKSRARFPELPMGYVPITSISWSFATKLDGELIRVNRRQLPVQPAFAVTGHSAEGKTLPDVLVNLHEGGFAAYVAASRPTSREGLCITRPVTLQMLNRPVPHDLYIEHRRLQTMEHNMLIKYGFENGTMQDLFDPETEIHTQYKSIHPTFDIEPNSKQNKKRKSNDKDASTQGFPCSKKKKAKLGRKIMTQKSTPVPGGCVWSQTDWSCAYDSFFMIFFYMYHSSSQPWRVSWSTYSPLTISLNMFFEEMSLAYNDGHHPDFNRNRDKFRDILSAHRPRTFPRRGHATVDVTEIFEQLDSDARHDHGRTIQRHCFHCDLNSPSASLHLPSIIHPAMLTGLQNNELPLDNPFTIQDWLNIVIDTQTDDLNIAHACPTSSEGTDINLQRLPYLHFDVPQEMANCVLPSKELVFPTINSVRDRYQLKGIIYHGQLHFTARLVNEHNMIWGYDGQDNMGVPFEDQMTVTNVSDLAYFRGRQACVYVFQHM